VSDLFRFGLARRLLAVDDVAPELTSDLDHWEVRLTSGEVVSVRAHGMKEQDGAHVFVALMKGSPAVEYELVRIPSALVDDVEGGGPKPQR